LDEPPDQSISASQKPSAKAADQNRQHKTGYRQDDRIGQPPQKPIPIEAVIDDRQIDAGRLVEIAEPSFNQFHRAPTVEQPTAQPVASHSPVRSISKI
jgi:hypothetical protein